MKPQSTFVEKDEKKMKKIIKKLLFLEWPEMKSAEFFFFKVVLQDQENMLDTSNDIIYTLIPPLGPQK